jgi:hypothetical protein
MGQWPTLLMMMMMYRAIGNGSAGDAIDPLSDFSWEKKSKLSFSKCLGLIFSSPGPSYGPECTDHALSRRLRSELLRPLSSLP